MSSCATTMIGWGSWRGSPAPLRRALRPARPGQTLMRWLFHFLPGRYVRLPSRRSEVVARAGWAG
jgi:hypothetical protein